MNFKTFNFNDIKRSERYFLMSSTIIPRPIAVVGTVDSQGRDNLAPFSYFNAISSDPPCLMFSVTQRRDGVKKDTLRNIEETKEFVVHISSSKHLSLVEGMSEDLPFGESERERLGLTATPSNWIKVPRTKEFAVAYECVLEKLIDVNSNMVVFGKILGAHIREDLLTENPMHASPFILDPLARLGQDYAKITPLK